MSTRQALADLLKRDGSITPASVLDAARDPASPLHARFTWDDGEAAEKYRLVEAGRLIRKCKVLIQVEPERVVTVRQFSPVPISDDGTRAYVATADALANPERRDHIVAQAMREVAALRRKYEDLIDFDAVLKASVSRRTKKQEAA